jgi:hypothetical protein
VTEVDDGSLMAGNESFAASLFSFSPVTLDADWILEVIFSAPW